jgi:hypothetical protein
MYTHTSHLTLRMDTHMSLTNACDFCIDLLDRADALRDTDLFLSRNDLDRHSFQRMYMVVDAYVQEDDEWGIDDRIIDDFDALLSEWESLLFGDDEAALTSFYEGVYA